MSLLARIFKRRDEEPEPDPAHVPIDDYVPAPAPVTVEVEALKPERATTGTVPVVAPDPAPPEPAPPEPPAWMAFEADVEPVVTAAAPQPEPQPQAENAERRALDEAEIERRLCALLDALGSAHRKPFVHNG